MILFPIDVTRAQDKTKQLLLLFSFFSYFIQLCDRDSCDIGFRVQFNAEFLRQVMNFPGFHVTQVSLIITQVKNKIAYHKLTALNRGGLWHQNFGTHYLTQAEQFELSRLSKTVLEH